MSEFSSRTVRILSILLVGVILTMIAPMAAMAATTADVTITATPTYIAMTNTPSTWAIGVVAAATNYSTSLTYFTANNTGSVASNIDMAVTGANWTGGVGWVHSNTAAAGVDTAGLIGMNSTQNITIKTTSMALTHALAASTISQYGLTMIAPTSFGDGVLKTVVLRLTISQHT
jgi:hypothetical protein